MLGLNLFILNYTRRTVVKNQQAVCLIMYHLGQQSFSIQVIKRDLFEAVSRFVARAGLMSC